MYDISIILTLLAVSVIIIVFIYAFNGISKRTSLSNDATSILTTIGIFFTFLGISIALFNFDPQNINESIPQLLGGLKVAFLSSVAGLGSGLVYKFIKPLYEIQTESGRSDIGPEDLYSSLQKIDASINDGNKTIKDSLVGDGDASLSTQFGKLRNDFRDFADKVTEDSSQKLIEALENVIKDFNQKISEQFGENFKELNKAVGALLIWQKEHKDHVEKLTIAYEKTVLGIENINNSFKEIEISTSKIPDSMTNIENIFKNTNERMEQLYKGLHSLSDMRKKAEESLPFIHEQITSMTDGLKVSVDSQLDSIQHAVQLIKDNDKEVKQSIKDINDEVMKSHGAVHSQIQSSIKDFSDQTQDLFSNNYKEQEQYMIKQKDQFQGLVDSLNMSADNILEQSQKSSKNLESSIEDTMGKFKNLINEFGEAQNNFNNDIKTNLNESVNNTQDSLNTAIKEVNAKMGETLNNALSVLADNLVSTTTGLAKGYQDSTEKITTALRNLKE